MRLSYLVATASAFLVATQASASTNFAEIFSDTIFRSKGECERTLNRERNERRQNEDWGRYTDEDIYNAWARWYFDCAEIAADEWVIVRIR